MREEGVIDTAGRQRLAAAIAGYMRGEIDNLKLDDVVSTLRTKDRGLNKIAFGIWFIYDDFKSHPVSVDAIGWDALRRVVAFLKSDLELPQPAYRLPPTASEKFLAFVSLVLILFSCYFAYHNSPTFLLIPATLIGVPQTTFMIVDSRIPRAPSQDELFYPFATETEWRQHEPLVLTENLPPYDPGRQRVQVRSRILVILLGIPGFIIITMLMPLVVLRPLLPFRRRSTLQNFR